MDPDGEAMSRVEYSEIKPGDSGAAQVNTILSAVATESAGVDGQNVAHGGLDKRAMATNIQSRRAFNPIEDTTTTPIVAPFGPATLVVGATTFRSGAIVLAAGERMRVRACVEYETDLVNPGIPGSNGINFGRADVHIAQSVAAVVTVIAESFAPVEAPWDSNPTIMTTAVIDGPVSLDWVEIQIEVPFQHAQVGSALLYGQIFKGVS